MAASEQKKKAGQSQPNWMQNPPQAKPPPMAEAAWGGLDVVQGLLILFERIVFLDGLPGELTYLGNRGEVDTVLLASLELGEGMLLVAIVYHQHVPVDVKVHVSLVETEESCCTLHGSHDAGCVGSTLHENATGT